MLSSVAPVLLVRDVVAAANYYRDKLGFTYDRFWGDPPNFCMVRREGLTLMLSQVPASSTVVPHRRIVKNMWGAYFWVKGVDKMYEEFRSCGAIIDYTLHDKPYGVREFGVQDLDGHDIAFGEIIAP